MVVPIIIGIGATVAALTARSVLSASRIYARLTPAMIASINNVVLEPRALAPVYGKAPHKDAEMHRFLRQHYPPLGFAPTMTEQEALLIMGIEGSSILSADRKLLKERYRKLMVANHPDKQGSQYLSQKINQAKDVLDKSYMFKE